MLGFFLLRRYVCRCFVSYIILSNNISFKMLNCLKSLFPALPPIADLPSNPCDPNPCGPYSKCLIGSGGTQAVCSCLSGYRGSPPACKPECVISSECTGTQACVNWKCVQVCNGICAVGKLKLRKSSSHFDVRFSIILRCLFKSIDTASHFPHECAPLSNHSVKFHVTSGNRTRLQDYCLNHCATEVGHSYLMRTTITFYSRGLLSRGEPQPDLSMSPGSPG